MAPELPLLEFELRGILKGDFELDTDAYNITINMWYIPIYNFDIMYQCWLLSVLL